MQELLEVDMVESMVLRAWCVCVCGTSFNLEKFYLNLFPLDN